ncbi:TRAP transporter small permease [Sulfurospirillum arcachonense]|uniref:TRAP transporter small permease n=1 Tax=Sulfurospirillum arcachonense TaxID=57666 RepID=UPI00046995D4|nr:TRAP transporter small permease [Sulfurospirillum arcachonense]
MGKFFTILDLGVASINKNMAVLGMILGVVLAFMNVVMRYIFDSSFTWAGELTNYLFMWGALFGAAYGFKKGIHISVTLLLAQLPPAIGKALLIFAHTLSFIYLAAMSYFGYQLVLIIAEFDEMSVDLNIPMWIPNLVLPLAFGAAAFRAGEKIYEVSITDADEVMKKEEEELIHDTSEIRGADV